MARRLYALGIWAGTHRRAVIAGWLLLLAIAAGLGVGLHGELSRTFSVPGIESQRAQELLQQKFPVAAGGTARVVFAAAPGQSLTTASNTDAISTSLLAASHVSGVVAVSSPASTGAISSDHRIAYSDVVFGRFANDVPQSAKDALSAAMEPARRAGLQVEFGGTAETARTPLGGSGELVGVIVAFVVLGLALSSVIAAGLPLLTALVGVGIGVFTVEFLARFLQLTDTATVLATMIGLAVGIDYTLFIVSRHRERLTDPNQDVLDSAARAVATAGSSVVFAGTSVIIALVALSSAGIPFLTVMGLAAAGTVLVAVLVATTLVPALLAVGGERLRPRQLRATRLPTRSWPRRSAPGTWGRAWGRQIARAPIAVLILGTIGLLVLALPARHLRLGLPSNESQPTSSTQHRGYELLTAGFGPGFNATLAVVIDASAIPARQRAGVISTMTQRLRSDADITSVASPIANTGETVVVLSVVPKTGPDDSATVNLVHRLRSTEEPIVTSAGGRAFVAGNTATDIDVSARLGQALPLFVGLIVLLAFALITVAFRSLLVPLTAVLGFLLSVAASLGAVVWILQFGHLRRVVGAAAATPVVSFVPVLLIGVLFGLAIDYEVFLVSRMREDFDSHGDARAAVSSGVEHSGRVVAAAAVIMSSVFAGFIFTTDPIIKSIALALTIGVLIDACVVRLTLVPAVMFILGKRAWWLPGWLERHLPIADIEGNSLAEPTALGQRQTTSL